MKLFGLNISRASQPATCNLQPATAKAFDPQAWLSGQDADLSEGAKLVTPYAQSSWVYIAISTLAQNISQIPFRISRLSGAAQKELAGYRQTRAAGQRPSTKHLRVLNENIIESGAVVDLFERPHPSMDRALYWSSIVTWEALRGEFFVLPLDDQDLPVDLAPAMRRLSAIAGKTSPVQRLLTVAPEMFWHMVQGYELVAWRYTGSPLVSPIPSIMLAPTEVVQCRSVNPYLYWRGLSPITLAMLPASSDYAAEQFMRGLMMNNADTGVIVETEQQASKDQREAIMSALRERKRKAGTPDRPLLLWGGMKVVKPTLSSVDMQFLENRAVSRQEICAIFGVPESMLGFTNRSKSLGGGGEMEQDKLNFIESKIIPHCRRYEAAHDPIIKTFGDDLVGYFDVDDLPILQQARRTRLDAGAKAWAMGVPFNTLNTQYDLGFPDIDGGDIGYLPFSVQPISEASTPQEPTPADPNTPSPKPSTSDPADPNQDHFSRAATLLSSLNPNPNLNPSVPAVSSCKHHVCTGSPAHESALAPRAKQKLSKLRRFFFEQKSRILSKLPDVLKEFEHVSHQSHSSHPSHTSYWLWKPKSSLSRGLDDLFDLASEDSKLTRHLKPLLVSDLDFGGAQLYKEIGLDHFSLAPKDALAFLDKRAKAISGINQTTWDRLKESLQEGLQDGDSMDALTDRVRVFFAGQDARAEVIANTETNVAVNGGRQAAMVQAKVPRKGWQTSNLENTRATHTANQQHSEAHNGIPIDEEWPNGCQYPGDPDGDPGETINCRCFGFAILGEGKSAS